MIGMDSNAIREISIDWMKKLALAGMLWVILASPAWPFSSLEKMELAFVGNPTISMIRRILDGVMRDHSFPISDENYSRAGSALVAIRKQTGVSEMDILRCMQTAKMGSYNVSFSDGVAICAITLSK